MSAARLILTLGDAFLSLTSDSPFREYWHAERARARTVVRRAEAGLTVREDLVWLAGVLDQCSAAMLELLDEPPGWLPTALSEEDLVAFEEEVEA